MRNDIHKKVDAFKFLLPLIVLIFAIRIIPALYTVYSSFFDWKLTKPGMNFVFLDNYKSILTDEVFWNVLWITLVWTVVSTFFHIVLGMVLSVSLNKVDSRFMAFARIILIFPYVVPGVIAATLWRWLLSGDYGYINDILLRLNIISSYQTWLGNTSTALGAVIIANIWKGISFYIIFFYTALQGISKDLYEAAKIDGAGFWGSLFFITIPLIKPVIIVASMLGLMWSLNFFDLIYVMTAGGPAQSTEILPIYIYNKAFVFRNMSLGATASTIVLAIALVFIILRINQDRKDESIYE